MGGLLFAVAAVFAAGAALAQPVGSLTVTNTDRGTVTRLPMPNERRFSITYRHSIYDAPVTEEFEVGDDGALVLRVLHSPSPAVLEYFGVTTPGSTHRRNVRLSGITMRIAMGAEQRLVVGDRDYSLLRFGDHGDRIVLEHRRTPARPPESADAGAGGE